VPVYPGTILRAGNPITKGREAFLEPLVLVVDYDDGLTPSVAKITVVSQAGGFGWYRVKAMTALPALR
jgi:hypothetical protein